MKTIVITSVFCAIALSAFGLSFAQTEVPHTFQSGQPARAAEVNENFSAVTSEIDANAAALADNEAAIQANAEAIVELSSDDVIVELTNPGPSVASGTGTLRPPPTVLNLSSLPLVIDEAGVYILDQDWEIDVDSGFMAALIDIQATNVEIDFREFKINTDYFLGTVIQVAGAGSARIMNGRIGAGGESRAVVALGPATITDMRMSSSDQVYTVIFWSRGTMLDSSISGGGVAFKSGGSLRSSSLSWQS